MPREILAGPDLRLRPIRLRDARALLALVEANRPWLRRWLPWLDAHQRLDQTRAFIDRIRELERRGITLTCGLWWQGELVGMVGFNWIDRLNRTGHVGYWIAEDQAGRGLVTRAVAALLAHGFGELGLHRVEIRAAVRNRASRRVAERLGFRHEGTLRQAEWLYGKPVDHALYGRLATDT